MKFPLFDWLYLVVLTLFIYEVIKLIFVYARRKKADEGMLSGYPFVTVIIPARNEEARIGDCLEGLLQQDYPEDRFSVIAVDDHSEDDTRSIIEDYCSRKKNFSFLIPDSLPKGWGGKSYANHFGYQRAQGEFILFMDADVIAKPALLSRVIFHMVKNNLDVVSMVSHRILISWSEKIFLPPLFIMIANALESKRVKLTGEFILFRRTAYDAIGGHAAIRSTVSDDLDFAALLEKRNLKTEFLFGEDLASTRMYDNFPSVYKGISKMFQRLLSEQEWMGAWRSTKYFLFVALAVTSLFLFLRNFHPQLFHSTVLLALPLLVLGVLIAETFYLRISFLYSFFMPLGWLFQPVLFIRSITGKRKRFYTWRGRKVFHQTGS